MSQFSQELCKLESSNMVYTCIMSDCIVGLRLRVMAVILQYFILFLSFPGHILSVLPPPIQEGQLLVTAKICARKIGYMFVSQFSQELLYSYNLEIWYTQGQ